MSLDLGLALGLFPTKKKMTIAIQEAIARKVGTEVATYSDLPDATEHDGEYAWVLSSQGTKWLPGTVGGTYYPKGLYYAAAGAWQFTDTPIQANQTEVNAGVDSDTFVSPYTLANTPLIRKVQVFNNDTDFPTVGTDNVIYIEKATDKSYYWDTSAYVQIGGASSAETIQLVDTSGFYWYVGYGSRIDRIDPSTSPSTKLTATITNLSTGWPNRASLTYT